MNPLFIDESTLFRISLYMFISIFHKTFYLKSHLIVMWYIYYLHMESKIQLRKMTSYSYHKTWELSLLADIKKALTWPSPSHLVSWGEDPSFLSDRLKLFESLTVGSLTQALFLWFSSHTWHLTELKEPMATASKRQSQASSTSWTPSPQKQS